MNISELKKLKWSCLQIVKSSNDAGLVTFIAHRPIKGTKAEEALTVEFGWFLRKPAREKAELERNMREKLNLNFVTYPDPLKPEYDIGKFIEDLPWKEVVGKTIPKDLW